MCFSPSRYINLIMFRRETWLTMSLWITFTRTWRRTTLTILPLVSSTQFFLNARYISLLILILLHSTNHHIKPYQNYQPWGSQWEIVLINLRNTYSANYYINLYSSNSDYLIPMIKTKANIHYGETFLSNENRGQTI